MNPIERWEYDGIGNSGPIPLPSSLVPHSLCESFGEWCGMGQKTVRNQMKWMGEIDLAE